MTSSATGPPSAPCPGTSTSYNDASASPATTYTYTVDARDGAGNVSQPSARATATTPSGTVSPTLVQAAGSTTSHRHPAQGKHARRPAGPVR